MNPRKQYPLSTQDTTKKMKYEIMILAITLFLVTACTYDDKEGNGTDARSDPKMIKIVSVAGYPKNDEIKEFEFTARLDQGSGPIDAGTIMFMDNGNNIAHSDGKCSYDDLPEPGFCYEIEQGDNDRMIEKGERFILKYRAGNSLLKLDDYAFNISCKRCASIIIEGTSPETFRSGKVIIWQQDRADQTK